MPFFTGVNVPDANSDMSIEERVDALTNAVYELNKKLGYSMNNIDEGNFSSGHGQSAGATTIDALAQKVSALAETVKQMKSYVDANAAFAQTIISAINGAPGADKITSDKLDLIGYGGLDGQFRVRALDVVDHPFAIIGDTVADNEGRIAGGSYTVGNMVLEGETIDHAKKMPSLDSAPKLKINAGNLNYITGAAAMQNILGIDSSGNIRLFGAYVEDGNLIFSSPSAVTLPAASARTVSTIHAWMPAIGLDGYKLPDENSGIVGGTYSESEYIYTANIGRWYYITHQVDISGGSVTAKNAITPRWIKPYEGEFATYTRNCTL